MAPQQIYPDRFIPSISPQLKAAQTSSQGVTLLGTMVGKVLYSKQLPKNADAISPDAIDPLFPQGSFYLNPPIQFTNDR